MRARIHLPRGERFYRDALEGLVRVNAELYRENPSLPSIYGAGVRYRGYDPGEDWRNVQEVVRDKWGDCEDLAAARAGELRARGDNGAYADIRRTGPRMTHAFVVRGDGTIEDPSRALGMGKREQLGGTHMSGNRYPGYDSVGASYFRAPTRATLSKASLLRFASKVPLSRPKLAPTGPTRDVPHPLPGAPADDNRPDPFQREPDFPTNIDFDTADSGTDDYGDRDEEEGWGLSDDDFEQLGADPAPSNELSFVINRIPSGWQGIVKVPFIDGRALTVARTAASKPAAAASALSTASNILDSPLAKALIPPQAQAMLSVIRSPTAQKAAAVALKAAKKLKFW